MIVTAVYEDNTVKDVTGAVRISGYDKTKGGEQKITVAYGQQTATFTINELYTITVDGIEVTNGVYGTKFTVTADPEKDGKKFVGWKMENNIISTDLHYTSYILNNENLSKVYGEDIQMVPKVICRNVLSKKEDDPKKIRISWVGQIIIPKDYVVEAAGLIWTKKTVDELPVIYDQTGNPMQGARKVESKSINRQGQFTININGVPEGGTVRAIFYAQMVKENEVKWLFSEEDSKTNIGGDINRDDK